MKRRGGRLSGGFLRRKQTIRLVFARNGDSRFRSGDGGTVAGVRPGMKMASTVPEPRRFP